MSRVTSQTTAGPIKAWEEDTWYPVALQGYEMQPQGRPITYQGKTKPHPWNTLHVTWVLLPDIEEDVQIHDFVDLKLVPNRDGSASNCKLLICTLAGRSPMREANPWIDAETLEYGFNALDPQDPAAGRITAGIRLQVKGVVKENDRGRFLNVKRYALPETQPTLPGVAGSTPATSNPTPATVSTLQLSADGQWVWNGLTWEPAQRTGGI